MRRMSELDPSTSASRVDSFTCNPSLWQICSMRLEICSLVGFLHTDQHQACQGLSASAARAHRSGSAQACLVTLCERCNQGLLDFRVGVSFKVCDRVVKVSQHFYWVRL